MHRYLFALLFLMPPTIPAQEPSPPPDYKALYEQANDTAAKWKAKAEAQASENAQLRDRLNLATASRPVDPDSVAKEQARAKKAQADMLAMQGRRWQMAGKVLSVTHGGVIVSCDASGLAPDKLFFLESEDTSWVDGQAVSVYAVQMPEPYEYTSVNNARRRIPRFRVPPN